MARSRTSTLKQSVRPARYGGQNKRFTYPPRFDAWFRRHAPDMTNKELLAAIQREFGIERSLGAVQQLRLNLRVPQSAAARRRAVDTRNNAAAPPAPPEPPSELQRQVHSLRLDNQALLRRLEIAKIKNLELVAAVYDAAKQAADQLNLDPVTAPKFLRQQHLGSPETALTPLADWQLAKRTSTYNSDVCEERIERYGDRVIRLIELQRKDHPVTRILVPLLGDLIEGELIFPGQSYLIDASLFNQVLGSGPRILGNFLRRMAGVVDLVEVDGVIGNHGSLGGKSRRDYHPESNADAMMYEATRLVLKNESRIIWAPNIVDRERKWYSVPRVGDFGFLCFHGDQVRGGFAGFPWYGFGKKIMGWHMGAIPEPFQYALSGHFHTPVRGLYGGVRHWGSGSTESSNTYAAENLAAQGTPSQWLLFCHPKRGVSAEYEVHLGE